ncbi:unnamed protein product [Peniophora sp. CBMAI 1063]|nr:unnamed protein product [Peniophora sp. CBMAI 1063]
MLDPTFPLAPISNIVASILVLLTLVTSSYRGPYDRGIVMLKGWVMIGLFKMSIQTIVWRNSYEIILPVFCDISSHLEIGLAVGLPACSLVMTRRLWIILDGEVSPHKSVLHGTAFVDYFLGFGVPIMHMTLYYVVQTGRFQVFESYGCGACPYRSGVTILLLTIWPLILPMVSISLYCWRIALCLYRYWHVIHRTESGRRDWDRVRYTRLLAISLIDIFLSLPVGIILFISNNFFGPHYPFWPGWDVIHNTWEPASTPASTWQGQITDRFVLYWNEWVLVVYAVAIFALFGFAPDAMNRYRAMYHSASSCLRGPRRRGTSLSNTKTSTSTSDAEIGSICRPFPSVKGHQMREDCLTLDTVDGPWGGLLSVSVDIFAGHSAPEGEFTAHKPRASKH